MLPTVPFGTCVRALCHHFQGVEVNLSNNEEDSYVVLCVLW
jgi:hypothetical protein